MTETMTTANIATLRAEFFADAAIADNIDATELMPAGCMFGGDDIAYCGMAQVARDGMFATHDVDPFAYLFEFAE